MHGSDQADLARVALIHTLWAVFLTAATMYALAGPVFSLIQRARAHALAGSDLLAGALVGAAACAVMLAMIAAHLLAASGTRQRTRRAHTVFMSVIMCLSVPIGTIFGLYCLSVMGRPSVRSLFDPRAPSEPDRGSTHS